jgi:hypothetical protein
MLAQQRGELVDKLALSHSPSTGFILEVLEQLAELERDFAAVGHAGDGTIVGLVDAPALKMRCRFAALAFLAGLAFRTDWSVGARVARDRGPNGL